MAGTIAYHDDEYKRIAARSQTLLTFQDVAAWDGEASSEVEKIAAVVRELDGEIARQSISLGELTRERQDKSFLIRAFASKKDEKELSEHIERCRAFKDTLERLADALQEMIDFTPNNEDEKGTLLKELLEHKKSLQIKKREINAEMRDIRMGSRENSAKAGHFLGGFVYDRKLAAVQRRTLRYEREAALRPHEDVRASIERQLIKVEKDILFVQRIRG